MSAHAVSLAGRISEREAVLREFLAGQQEPLARACHDLARAFARGGKLIAFGTGSAATDAAHVAVEFMHPVIVGKRALPALAPTNDPARAGGLEQLGRPDDVALGIAHEPGDRAVSAFLAAAARRDMLTIALAPDAHDCDHSLVVRARDADVVQEAQETAYHVLWELVHVFFEHPGLLEDRCVTCGDVGVEVTVTAVEGDTALVEGGERVAIDLVEDVAPGARLLAHGGVALEKLEDTGFLYPFLERAEDDLDTVLADVRRSSLAKGEDVIALRRAIDLEAVERCGRAVGAALDAGGRLFTFGNGGSATDAQDAAADACRRGRPAVALVNDTATVTAVGNDVGFENVFARQLISLAAAGDVALAISTSGSSQNIVAGLEEARRRGMLTCAITGYDGGRLAELDWIDHLLVVRGDYVPRLQEAHATLYHLLLEVAG
jgi:D-sedoheptulose 7-phosphate isomerase